MKKVHVELPKDKGPSPVGVLELEDMLCAVRWQVQEFYQNEHANYAKIYALLGECIDLSDEITSNIPIEILKLERFKDSLGNDSK